MPLPPGLLLVAAAAAVLASVLWLVHRRKPDEEPTHTAGTVPHACRPGAFRVVTVTSRLPLLGSAPVFEGVFCRACRRELVCVVCGRWPETGSVIDRAELAGGVYACCEAPIFRVLPGRRIDGPDDSDGDAAS